MYCHYYPYKYRKRTWMERKLQEESAGATAFPCELEIKKLFHGTSAANIDAICRQGLCSFKSFYTLLVAQNQL